MKDIEKKLNVLRDSSLQSVAPKMLEDLINSTPIDTGKARSSWNLIKEDGKYKFVNSVEYIAELNNGSSKQAPRHFVEHVAMKYGKPIGTIVQEIP